jgi:hypothetical protein
MGYLRKEMPVSKAFLYLSPITLVKDLYNYLSPKVPRKEPSPDYPAKPPMEQ